MDMQGDTLLSVLLFRIYKKYINILKTVANYNAVMDQVKQKSEKEVFVFIYYT